MKDLPQSPSRFAERKSKILNQLAVPDSEYSDASPKGSVDEGIRDLIGEINAGDGFVTTSSCAGRVSVFLEGRKLATAGVGSSDADEADGEGVSAVDDVAARQVAGVGGKGAGGAWLFVSHDPVDEDEESIRGVAESLSFAADGVDTGTSATSISSQRLIHFKFEPMILHVLTASPAHAQLILRCALQAGFRESGAVNISTPTPSSSSSSSIPHDPVMPIVAVRSMGLGFESLLGFEAADGRRYSLVPQGYLAVLMRVANERFKVNAERIARFQNAFREAVKGPAPKMNPEGEEWEDAVARRERKRAEGLRRKAELEAQKGSANEAKDSDDT